jgi:serine/threonine-protein kinase HipA
MRSLIVSINHRQVGTLSEGDDLWVFDYNEAWAKAPDSFDLSPALPRSQLNHADGGSSRPVQWYFDNLLPEELLREAVAKEAAVQGDDAFALLTYLGAESAGSLTLLPPHVDGPSEGGLQALTDAALSQRINDMPRQTLTQSAPKRMSLAGAQHKLLVVMLGDTMYEPQGATPSTHILKPNHPDSNSYPASAFNEYATMKLARAAGLPVPKVALRYVPQPVYIIDRFDRVVQPGPKRVRAERLDAVVTPVVQRRHIIDACQLLNKARTFKHSGASLQSLLQVIERTTNKIDTRIRLFRWLVFNILVANDDCHLKNLSFYVSHDSVAMAPHYDLLATGAYYTRAFADEKATWGKVRMAFPLPGAHYFEDVTLASVLAAAAMLGLPEQVARRIVTEVVTRIPKAVAELKAELVQRSTALPPEARVALAAEARLLDVLEHIILRDMLGRLKE